MQQALIVQGGWTGHAPVEMAQLTAQMLTEAGFGVTVEDSLDAFRTHDLSTFDLLVPIWTMGKIEGDQVKPVLEAVRAGVGLGGFHGGMCDAFRENTDWQFMTGGQWVAHPGNIMDYTVQITRPDHPICAGVNDFAVTSEQYYLHVDPGVEVLATTVFESVGGVVMPVAWTKSWGAGRVFYCSVGHQPSDFAVPDVARLVRNGLVWAAR